MTKPYSKWSLGTALLISLALVGCGSAPRAQHYALEFTPTAGGAAGPGRSQVGVAAPRASHLLRQDRIVYFTSQNELNFYKYHRWAEPPAQMVQSLLMRQLRAAGLFDDVVAYRAQKGLDYVLRGQLLAMEEADTPTGINARFALELELVRQEDDHVVWTGRHSCQRAIPTKTVAAVVETLSGCAQESLTELTRSMGATVAQLPPPGEVKPATSR